MPKIQKDNVQNIKNNAQNIHDNAQNIEANVQNVKDSPRIMYIAPHTCL